MTTNHTPTPDDDTIVFPHFWMFKNEGGWRWVSRDGGKSSRAAFEIATQCALEAEHTLTKTAFVAESDEAAAMELLALTARVAELEAALRDVSGQLRWIQWDHKERWSNERTNMTSAVLLQATRLLESLPERIARLQHLVETDHHTDQTLIDLAAARAALKETP